MPATAKQTCQQARSNTYGNIVANGMVASLPTPPVARRNTLNSEPRPKSPRTLSKASSPASPLISSSLNEAEAIRRAQNGDEAMFEHLYRLHSRRVFAICVRMVKDRSDAEDLTQETFLLLFRKIRTFRGESAFSTWLHRLAVNRVLMRLRRRLIPEVSMEVSRDPNDESLAALNLGVPDLRLEGSIDRINLQRCIKRLPAGYRTVFVLHDVQGYKHQEIAELLGRSIGDSKSQLHKARSQLRTFLQEVQRGKARDRRLAAAKNLSVPFPPAYA
jgi:RNA polymerase sigma-70 factor (ECF subfamily)